MTISSTEPILRVKIDPQIEKASFIRIKWCNVLKIGRKNHEKHIRRNCSEMDLKIENLSNNTLNCSHCTRGINFWLIKL